MTTIRETIDRTREIVAVAILFATASVVGMFVVLIIFGYRNGIIQ